MAKPLTGMRIAILATDMFEEPELKRPREALEQAGAITELIAPKGPEIIAAQHFDKGPMYTVDRLLKNANPDDYDALLLPGGALNADQLRMEPDAQSFVRSFDANEKPIAAICHAPWLLVSAGLAKGRTMTSYYTIADDIKNAGGNWVDKAVVRDSNWVSSRQPDDIPAFNEAMIKLFHELASTYEATPVHMPEPAFGERIDTDSDAQD
jgi:protease I